MGQVDSIKTGMKDILPRAEFNTSHRYEDFDPKLDKVAAYGIGALVAGKLAAKTGLLAAFGVMLLNAKKLLILGAIAVAALVKKLFGNKEG